MDYNKEFNNLEINISSEGEVFDYVNGMIRINDIPLDQFISANYLSEENYNIIKSITISQKLEVIIDTVFLAIKDIEENQYDKTSANHITGYFFNHIKGVWNPNFNKYKFFIEINLWKELIIKVINWEKKNEFKIYKGTPYYFTAGCYLFTGNYDLAFNYTYLAMQEDHYHGTRQDPNFDYRNLPAFMFASLNENPNNYLYPIVRQLAQEVKDYIGTYNNEFNESFTFNTFKNKFSTQVSLYYEHILYFVYLLNILAEKRRMIQQFPNLYNNEFANMRNLDVIFSFCLFLDKLLAKLSNVTTIRGNTEYLITKLYSNWNTNDFSNLKQTLNINTDNINPIDKVKYILNYNCNNLIYQSDSNYTIKQNKQIVNSMLIYFLRNEGAHNIILNNLNASIFEQILNSLFFQLFIIIEYVL